MTQTAPPERDPFLPMDRGDRARVRQVARYLTDRWPTPFPVEVQFKRLTTRDDCVADTRRHRTRPLLMIRLDARLPLAWALDLLAHEWAHGVTWPATARQEREQQRLEHPHHGPDWAGILGAITADLDDNGGLDKSRGW